jgi:hypothetical protein
MRGSETPLPRPWVYWVILMAAIAGVALVVVPKYFGYG